MVEAGTSLSIHPPCSLYDLRRLGTVHVARGTEEDAGVIVSGDDAVRLGFADGLVSGGRGAHIPERRRRSTGEIDMERREEDLHDGFSHILAFDTPFGDPNKAISYWPAPVTA
jgi:hypothetical protein